MCCAVSKSACWLRWAAAPCRPCRNRKLPRCRPVTNCCRPIKPPGRVKFAVAMVRCWPLVPPNAAFRRGRGNRGDDRQQLRSCIAPALVAADVLLLSGGVSAGTQDLVPGVLAELGMRKIFHKVQVKPGKPLSFGAVTASAGRRLVFGLPGNPVSSYVGFQLFVRPALASLSGRADLSLPQGTARLGSAHAQRGDRPAYRPAQVVNDSSGATVHCIAWQGSGDLASLTAPTLWPIFRPAIRLPGRRIRDDPHDWPGHRVTRQPASVAREVTRPVSHRSETWPATDAKTRRC